MELKHGSYATLTLQGWDQFQRLLSGGIPHAEEIASTLGTFALRFPNSIVRNIVDVDLIHYSAVHHAYRSNKLRSFLTFMEQAKRETYWEIIKSCRETQFVVIDIFLKNTSDSVAEAIRLLPLWIEEQSRDDSTPMLRAA